MRGDMGGHGGFKAGLCNRQAIKNWATQQEASDGQASKASSVFAAAPQR